MSPEPRFFHAMGVDVAVGGASDEEFAAVRRLFERWDAVFSRFRPDSELNSVNRSPSPVLVVSELFARAVRAALGAAAATDGLVDPTLGRA
ncbi:MAG TPA: FAD:protein FMN transferase, partial [Gaiellaceae bacterium]